MQGSVFVGFSCSQRSGLAPFCLSLKGGEGRWFLETKSHEMEDRRKKKRNKV
jgi:hypothetical protein